MSGLIAAVTLAGALGGGVVGAGISPMPADAQSLTSSQPSPDDSCQAQPLSLECMGSTTTTMPSVNAKDVTDAGGAVIDWYENERKTGPNADDLGGVVRTGVDDAARTGSDDAARKLLAVGGGAAAAGGSVAVVRRHRKAHKQAS
jgi:hypothetical protein